MSQRPDPLLSDLLADASSAGIRHGYFSRHGGVSKGLYAGLNVGQGSNDRPEDIAENRSRVAGWFGQKVDALSTLYQVHSNDVVTVSEPLHGEARPKADAQVTDQPGIIIGVLTADCGPVLFADPDAGVIGAAHAGWKGAFTGVLENTINAMEKLGASRARILASLGPSISQANYEVGPEFYERFVADRPDWARFFAASDRAGHYMFDLPALTLARLEAAGVRAEASSHCTYADEERFFSFRRTTHRGEPDYGRQISAIMIEER